jgi:hypothetical protein
MVQTNERYCGKMVTKQDWISAAVKRTKLLGLVRITECSKYEWKSERVQASQRVANMYEAQTERRRANQRRKQLTGYAGENMFHESEILLTGVRC